ncbi:transaldolase [Alicyclobacillus sp. SO9]|uniref:transaldolase n=1 Tax=Alicyclobacillus sp. SO9 TaxID=2665646 RepID=UPI0018E709DB|nr:transaldolase [Alicyclobacillus sp. SO9]QQE77976.1 transaldolase [Alicyclobacillus sp. SO9]
MTSIKNLNECGQSVWYDNVDRGLLDSGEMERLIELGVSGVTSNPTIFERAITASTAYDVEIVTAVQKGKAIQEVYDSLTFADIGRVADLLMPVFEQTNHADGYVSIEVSPALSRDTEGTVQEGRRLFRSIDRPNVMIKVPATEEGIPAVRELIKDGINVNVTLIFSVEMYKKVVDAYLSGLESRLSGGLPLSVASVASFFVSRVDTKVDKLIREKGLDESLLGMAGVANAKMAYKRFEELFSDDRFEKLKANGAQVQRPLWASTGVKDPRYSELLYVSSLAGPHTVNTMPPKTLDAVLGTTEGFSSMVNSQVTEAEEVLTRLGDAGVSLSSVTDELLTEGLASFEKSFQTLLQNLKEKSESLRG